MISSKGARLEGWKATHLVVVVVVVICDSVFGFCYLNRLQSSTHFIQLSEYNDSHTRTHKGTNQGLHRDHDLPDDPVTCVASLPCFPPACLLWRVRQVIENNR